MRTLQNFLKHQQNYSHFKKLNYKQKNLFSAQEFDARIDYYATIGIPSTSSAKEIKTKYYELAKKYHPDVYKGQDDTFKRISDAYRVLGNADLRSQYDSVRAGGFASNATRGSGGGYSDQNYYNMHKKYHYQQQQNRKYQKGFGDGQNYYRQQDPFNQHNSDYYNQSEFYNTFKNNYFYTDFQKKSQQERDYMNQQFEEMFQEVHRQEQEQMKYNMKRMQYRFIMFGVTMVGFWVIFDFLIHKAMGTGRHKELYIYDEKANMMYQVNEEEYKRIQAQNRQQRYKKKEHLNEQYQQSNWVKQG